MRKNKVVQVLVIENEEFLKENEEFLKSEFEFDDYVLNENQLANIEINFEEEKKE